MGQFGLTILEAKRTTIVDFYILSLAKRIKDYEKRQDLHLQAFLNASVQGVKKNGKPVYGKFEDFYKEDFLEVLRPEGKQTSKQVRNATFYNSRYAEYLKMKGGSVDGTEL